MAEPTDSQRARNLAAAATEQAIAERVHLIVADQEARWRRGERVLVEAYLQDHAPLVSHPQALLDLLYHEIVQREGRGEKPVLEEYTRRFPHLVKELTAQFDFDRAILGEPTLVSNASGLGSASLEGSNIADLPGQVGCYRLEEEIARGAMGRIVRVRDQDFDRPLALKVLLGRGATVEERFLREARLTGLLQHPGIPPVHALGRLEDGRPYFVMKLILGRTLEALLKDRSSPAAGLPRLAGIFEHICQTVGYAHARGVLHRDLKPANVMVGAFGEVQVMDWGLAKFLGPTGLEDPVLLESEGTESSPARTPAPSDPTVVGTVLGTPAYMAPEQARGEVETLNAAADVFGLGAILCEILTGQPPFAGPNALNRAALGELAEALTHLADCGAEPGLVHLAYRCLALQPEDRPATGAVVAEAMAAYQAQLARRLRQVELDRAAEHARGDEEGKRRVAEVAQVKADRKRRWTALALAVTLLALLSVLVIGFIVNALVRTERDVAIDNQKRAKVAEQRAREAGKENQIRSHLGQAMALRQSHEPARRAKALQQIRAAVALEPSPQLRLVLRNEAIACLAIGLDLSPALEWKGWPTGSGHFAFDDKLELYAHATRQGSVSIRRVADDGQIGAPLPGGQGETWLRFSPDGGFLLTTTQTGITRAWKVGTSPPSLVKQWMAPNAYDFHPNKTLTAIGLKNGFVEVFDLSQKEIRYQIKVGTRVHAIAWHPKGEHIAIAHPNGIKVYDLERKQWVANETLDLDVLPVDLAWHPEGRALAIGDDDGFVRFWKVRSDKKVHFLRQRVGGGVRLAFNHRGDLLATTAWGEMLRLWDPRTGKQLHRLTWGSSEIPRFSLESRFIAASVRENHLQFWEVTSSTEYSTLVSDPAFPLPVYQAGAITQEGRLLAVARKDGVELWDLKNAALVSFLPIGTTYSVVLDHSPPGTLITSGPDGVYRWPIRADPKAASVRIGPPKKLALPGNANQVAVSRDGRIVAHSGSGLGGQALWQKPARLVSLGQHWDARYVTISSDRQWIATGSHNGTGACIWEANSGKFVHELLPNTPSWGVDFSADGQWLATQSPSCKLWKVGTWEQTRQIPGTQFGFAPNSKVLAVETGAGVVRLLDPASGQEWARLENPYRDPAYRIFFSPDGSRLVTFGSETYPLHVWDLRKIRFDLKVMGLDWDLPPYPALDLAWSEGTMQIQVDLGSLPYINRGNALFAKKDLKGAITQFQLAIDLDPNNLLAYNSLGLALQGNGQFDEAIAAYNCAISRDRKFASAHYNLGNALRDKGRPDEAIAAYKMAIEHNPDFAEAHCNLGLLLKNQGAFAEAVAEIAKGHSLGLRNPAWANQYRSDLWLKQAKRLVELDGKLPACLKGEEQPKDPKERLELARLCSYKKLYRAGVRFYTEAFSGQPTLAGSHRYDAACLAALAAVGKGKDSAGLDDPQRARLRRQCLDWLEADLAGWTRRVDQAKPASFQIAEKTLRWWQTDPDLAGVRDPIPLSHLSESDRAPWVKLWSAVTALRKRTQ